MSPVLFREILLGWTALAPIVFVALFFIAAPYGRHSWVGGPMLSPRMGWIVMELPAVLLMAFFFLDPRWLNGPRGYDTDQTASIIFLAMWETHYVHRTFIYPLRMKGKPKAMPLVTALGGGTFQIINVCLIGWQLFVMDRGDYNRAWLTDPRFLIGVVVFFFGFAMNFQSDTILLNLRRPGESGYKIPFGGMYRFVSCPNYLGELIEWTGFAIATWSLPTFAFAIWTAANLVPRAVSNHKWYAAQFPDYPKDRRAVLPFVL